MLSFCILNAFIKTFSNYVEKDFCFGYFDWLSFCLSVNTTTLENVHLFQKVNIHYCELPYLVNY